MELFSEVYGCYFTVVSRILQQTQNGLTKTEIENLVNSDGFCESTFQLLPYLFSGEWKLLSEKNNKYFSMIKNTKRPLTSLEKSWLKALIYDPKIRLFLDENAVSELENTLAEVSPLFLNEDFHVYDKHRDGDPYDNPDYISRFRIIFGALKNNNALLIEYTDQRGGRVKRQFHPYKLEWSARDDKFRLLCGAYNSRQKKLQRYTLNLGRVISAELTEFTSPDLTELFSQPLQSEVVLEISSERNALERCMLQFASFERITEYDNERDIYICRIRYDFADESELLIRILSFGPTIKVICPEEFLSQIKNRIRKQISYNSSE